MRWKPGRRSRNLEDRRAETGRRRGSGLPFPFPLPRRGGGRAGGRVGPAPRLSTGGLILLVIVFFVFRDPFGALLGEAGTGAQLPFPSAPAPADPSAGSPPVSSPGEDRLVDFVSFVLDDLQETWQRRLPGYRDAKLVLYRDSVRSGCGFGSAQMGPFYCPADEKVYVDLAFYEDLRRRFGAPGDFAQAYVLAHEIGHHLQKVMGIEPQVREAQRARPQLANQLSVRMELQADCLAGVWGHSAARRDILEPGDIEEGLTAAAAIGDDRMQRRAGGRVQPEAFTHGSSEQRVAWLRRGLESGDPDACDTFESRR